MRKLSFIIIICMLALAGCGSVPITGRKQLSLVSDQEVLSSSFQQYGAYIKSAPLSTNAQQTAMVVRVGQKIADAVENYLKSNGMEAEAAKYQWEFNLVKSDDVNAFCMPGGKIVVYEGILPYTKDETGLAVVLGHEVAHAVAKHANEQMSQQILKEQGASVLSSAMGTSSATVQQATSLIYGLGTQTAMLKYSRDHELEADRLGLIFMAMAGYDPNQAASFWTRMSSAGGSGTPEFLSTHPSDGTRIKKINQYLPEALQYYKGVATSSSNKTTTSPQNAKTSKDWTF